MLDVKLRYTMLELKTAWRSVVEEVREKPVKCLKYLAGPCFWATVGYWYLLGGKATFYGGAGGGNSSAWGAASGAA